MPQTNEPQDTIDYEMVRRFAALTDDDIDAGEADYLEPEEARALCRELLRLKEEAK